MTELTLDVYTSPMRDISTGGQFSPTTSTLLTGPTEAVLVDAQYMEGDVAELARRIESSGRTLTTIYITHAHADHYFGLEWLLDRFPTARAVALPAVVADIEATNDAARTQWRDWFSGQALGHWPLHQRGRRQRGLPRHGRPHTAALPRSWQPQRADPVRGHRFQTKKTRRQLNSVPVRTHSERKTHDLRNPAGPP